MTQLTRTDRIMGCLTAIIGVVCVVLALRYAYLAIAGQL